VTRIIAIPPQRSPRHRRNWYGKQVETHAGQWRDSPDKWNEMERREQKVAEKSEQERNVAEQKWK
jgi:hypothetical protein